MRLPTPHKFNILRKSFKVFTYVPGGRSDPSKNLNPSPVPLSITPTHPVK